MPDLKWTYKKFDELTTQELYTILQLRNEVFIVEQNCPYQDLDEKDQSSYHLCGWKDEQLVAYVRIIPPGICYEQASIGRVVTSPSFRKNGAGKILMQLAIDKTLETFNVTQIKIGAQRYLLEFYTSLGFKTTHEEYLEDGIPHVKMLLSR